MDIRLSTVWWVLAGLLVAAELTTGTFYLLMLALGMAAAAMVASLGFSGTLQIATVALVGGGGTALWHWMRMKHPRSAPAAQNRDVNLDIGERVNVVAWNPDRTTRVTYRGSTWTARLHPEAIARPGNHIVKAVEGNWLVLAPHESN